jgi:hypothetical protein
VLPTLPSLIAADPYAEEEEQPDPAPPDAGGTMVETHTSDTLGGVPMEPGSPDNAEPDNTPGDVVSEAESDDPKSGSWLVAAQTGLDVFQPMAVAASA